MSWFKSDPFLAVQLGTFQRTAGAWVTSAELTTLAPVELRLTGDRKAPAPANVALAHDLPAQIDALRAAIGRALYEHLEPYAEAVRAGELELDGFDPGMVRVPEDVRAHVEATVVAVDATREEFPIALRMRAAWDEERTLGVRIRGGTLVELCGSV